MKSAKRANRHQNLVCLCACELLEDRRLLSAVAFVTHDIIRTDAKNPQSVFAADVDGDGDVDVLSASGGKSRDIIAWYENTDGQGSLGDQQVITNSVYRARSVYTADVDGDGDVDVLSASLDYGVFPPEGKIAWYENTDGQGSFVEQQVISNLADSVYAADVDGDGDVDVLSASGYDGKIAWYENMDGQGRFGPQQVIISTEASFNLHEKMSLYAADVDGDGDVDVLSASAWYENTDGQGSFGPQQVINSEANRADSVAAADVDGDGDVDVLSASYFGNKIAWYENTDGQGSFGEQQVISNLEYGRKSFHVADVDGDGDVDVLSASSMRMCPDGPCYNKITWYENMDGQGSFGPQQVISIVVGGGPSSVYAVDVDGDGDIDALSANSPDNQIAWYENTDGEGTFGPQQLMTNDLAALSSFYAADVDVLSAYSASDFGGKIDWYENTDGQGSFGPQQVIISTGAWNEKMSLYAADADGDGDMDVLSASVDYGVFPPEGKFAWYENSDGQGSFVEQQVISNLADSVYAADVDGDGDVDVLSASGYDGKIAWRENMDGQWSFGPQQVITTDAEWASSVYVADLDGDEDMDVLSASGDIIAWYQNTDGQGSFGDQQVITNSVDDAQSVYAADVDGDGDVDVLCASKDDHKIAWYENTDGQGSFGDQQVITNSVDDAQSIYAADVDGDGDVDVLSASVNHSVYLPEGKITWYENRGTPIAGDANLDGTVDGLDFNIWNAYRFQDAAWWERGDFNGDRVVDGSDFNIWNDNKFQAPVAAPVSDRIPRAALPLNHKIDVDIVVKNAHARMTTFTERPLGKTIVADDSHGDSAWQNDALLRSRPLSQRAGAIRLLPLDRQTAEDAADALFQHLGMDGEALDQFFG